MNHLPSCHSASGLHPYQRPLVATLRLRLLAKLNRVRRFRRRAATPQPQLVSAHLS